MVTQLLRAPSAGPGPASHTCVQLVRGIAVLTVLGRLGGEDLPQYRAAMDTVVPHRPGAMVLDAQRIAFDERSVEVLGLIRRLGARRRMSLWVAAAPLRLLHALDEAGVAGLYQVAPTVPAALRAATSRIGAPAPR